MKLGARLVMTTPKSRWTPTFPRHVAGRLGAAAVVLAAALLLALPAAASTGMCVPADLEDVDAAVAASIAEDQVEIATRGLALACELSPGLESALSKTAMVPPDMREAVIYRGLADSPLSLFGICEEPIDVMIAVGQAAPADHRGLIATGCDLHKLANVGDIPPETSSAQIFLALAVYNALDADDVKDARKYGRWLLGVDLPPPADDIMELVPFEALPEPLHIEPEGD